SCIRRFFCISSPFFQSVGNNVGCSWQGDWPEQHDGGHVQDVMRGVVVPAIAQGTMKSCAA
ncbi:hypothetical protein, partial [Escherichia coli]|uniref:hypothetical protein n=1 Tax=Escherichia coli TaxID=562 RepID=UPI0019D4E2E1